MKDMFNARTPLLVDLHNIASGYIASSDTNTKVATSTQFFMGNPTFYPGSESDGTVTETIRLWGALEDRFSTDAQPKDKPITIDILIQLLDGTFASYEADITDKIKYLGDRKMEVELFMETAIPETEPEEEGGESGMSSELEKWGQIHITIPLG